MSNHNVVWTLAALAVLLVLVPLLSTVGMMSIGGMMHGGAMMGMGLPGALWLLLTLGVIAALVVLLLRQPSKTS